MSSNNQHNDAQGIDLDNMRITLAKYEGDDQTRQPVEIVEIEIKDGKEISRNVTKNLALRLYELCLEINKLEPGDQQALVSKLARNLYNDYR